MNLHFIFRTTFTGNSLVQKQSFDSFIYFLRILIQYNLNYCRIHTHTQYHSSFFRARSFMFIYQPEAGSQGPRRCSQRVVFQAVRDREVLIASQKLLSYVTQPAPTLIYIFCTCFHSHSNTPTQRTTIAHRSGGGVNGCFSSSTHKLYRETARVCVTLSASMNTLSHSLVVQMHEYVCIGRRSRGFYFCTEIEESTRVRCAKCF